MLCHQTSRFVLKLGTLVISDHWPHLLSAVLKRYCTLLLCWRLVVPLMSTRKKTQLLLGADTAGMAVDCRQWVEPCNQTQHLSFPCCHNKPATRNIAMLQAYRGCHSLQHTQAGNQKMWLGLCCMTAHEAHVCCQILEQSKSRMIIVFGLEVVMVAPLPAGQP